MLMLLKKEREFKWEESCQQSLDRLKDALASALVLKLPEFTKPFEVTTDTSGRAICTILVQENHIITYMSRKLKAHKKNYPTHDLELLSIICALRVWRHHLLWRHRSLITTNHKSLKYIFTEKDLNMRRRR